MSAADQISLDVMTKKITGQEKTIENTKQVAKYWETRARTAESELAQLKSDPKSTAAAKIANLEAEIKILKNSLEVFYSASFEGEGAETVVVSNSQRVSSSQQNEGQKKTIDSLQETIRQRDLTIECKDKTIDENHRQLEAYRINLSNEVKRVKSCFDDRLFNNNRAKVAKLFIFRTQSGAIFNPSADELIVAYQSHYPNDPSFANARRRADELCKGKYGNLLFKHPDEKNDMRYYLRTTSTAEDFAKINMPWKEQEDNKN